MHIRSFVGAGIGGFAIFLTAASPGATNVTTAPVPPLHVQFANHGRGMRPATYRRPSYTAPAGCTKTDAGVSFVGIPSESDYAGTNGSAVVAGETNESCAYDSTIAGGSNNIITAVSGDPISNASSFIGGGEQNAIAGTTAFVGSGYNNESTGAYSFLGAGTYNAVEGYAAFVGAGDGEYFDAYALNHSTAGPGNLAGGADSFVGAGDLNQISSSGNGSFIGAGGYAVAAGGASTASNQISGVDSFIGAGDQNSVAGSEAFIGSGKGNTIVAGASYAVVGGGHVNTATTSYAAVTGGTGNTASGVASSVGGGWSGTAGGTYATVPGGYLNAATGVGSFAAGSQAKARHDGAFVWSDNASSTPLQSTGNYQFKARASGGFYLYSGTSGIGAQLPANSGSWGVLSDRTMKTNVVALDDAAVLDKVAALPVSEWSYTAERGVRHVGPMAQDFYAAFGVGEDNRHIATIDEDGVALAAIKALRAENASLRRHLARQDERIAEIERRLSHFSSK